MTAMSNCPDEERPCSSHFAGLFAKGEDEPAPSLVLVSQERTLAWSRKRQASAVQEQARAGAPHGGGHRCLVVGFKDGKVSHEPIYWDQTSVLVQLGLLDPAGLPVGVEVARRVRDPSLPAREY